MFYRIDQTHFLSHMIDYFPARDLIKFQYVVVSQGLAVQALCANVKKIALLFPDKFIREDYLKIHDKNILRKRYLEQLNPTGLKLDKLKHNDDYMALENIYRAIVYPVVNTHYDIILVSMAYENDYIDILCDFINDVFKLPCIDLNKLFIDGETEIYELDYDEIKKRGNYIKRLIGEDERVTNQLTEKGREKNLERMTLSEKIKELKKFGIKVSKSDKHRIDTLLMEAWDK